MEKQDIKNFTIEELERRITELSEPSFRAKQILDWLYRKGVSEFSGMRNLPKNLQERLDGIFYISRTQVLKIVQSSDGSEKFLFRLSDGNFVETVLIPKRKRATICLSTQVGCKYNCAFCASGKNGFTRNLTLAEIINQLLFIRFEHNPNQKITNVVFMGMGEPFDNYDNLVRAISVINSPKGIFIGARKITVSTCGIIPGIKRFQTIGRQVELSVSFHAADEKLRSKLMPVNKKYPLKELISTLADYTRKTGRIITLEYLLVKNVNDSAESAEKLAGIAKYLKAKVNLIGYNPITGKNYRMSEKNNVALFESRLSRKGVTVTIRNSQGKDIAAACGQLGLAGKRNEIRSYHL